LQSFYESTQLYNGDYSGGTWYDQNGNSAFASDPSWANLLQWEKGFIADVYGSDGYHKLQEFFSKLGGPDSEWSSAHGFETQQVAMMMDGEWRNAFIADDGSNVNYGTAPFPVADDQTSDYGSGYIVTNTFTVPTGAQHPYEAWLLAKFLSTDTASLVRLGDQLKNIPDTTEALQDPKLTSNDLFSTFLKIYQDPNSSSPPTTPSGADWQGLVDDFAAKWQAGKVPDLNAGLQQTANQIDQQLSQGTTG
jgi:multiple sugar transport system substrate-binding protein